MPLSPASRRLVAASEDGALARLLQAAGIDRSASEVESIVAGVAAAPASFAPDAWLTLISPAPLPAALAARLHELEAAARARLSVPALPLADRLAALRRRLQRMRLAGLVIPRADEHQGEIVAPRSERLRWITGFSGSAGLAVVLADRAALFVDGRYTVQARGEVDEGLFEIRHVLNEPPGDWIAMHLPEGGRLGYDPWLLTQRQLPPLEAACARAGGRLVAVRRNPVDLVWRDQPPPPLSPVVVHDLAFAGVASADKRQQLARELSGRRQQAAVLTQPDGIAWLLNIRGADVPYTPLTLAFAILHADASVELFLDPRKVTAAVRAHLGEAVSIAPPGVFAEALQRLGQSRATVAVDPHLAPVAVVQQLQKAGATVAFGPDPCVLPKAIKNPVELAGVRAAHLRDGVALCRFLAWLAAEAPAGRVSEIDAVERLAAFRAMGQNYRGPSFPTISAAASNGAIVHYRVTEASNRRLEPGTLYLVDSGGQYLDGTTDVTRTVAIGPADEQARIRFTQVLKGHIALARAVFPKGTTGTQLDTLARLALWQAGVDYDHGTGHGVGAYLGVHEGPQRISKQPSPVPLACGMVMSNEPGYYRPGAYGIRIENLVTVVAAPNFEDAELEMLGFETLTLAPIDRSLVCGDRLTDEEREWLDAYHRRVREALSPLLDAATAAWLAAATAPIDG